MQIRPVTVEDASGIADLMNHLSARAMRIESGPWSAQDSEAWLGAMPPGTLHLAAIDETDGLVGIQHVRPAGLNAAEIGTYIQSDYQKQGVGTVLFQNMRERMQVLGTHMVWATIRPHETGALHYYRQQGFEVIRVEACRVRVRWRDITALQSMPPP
jgi:L-amino acid N-acyltransferase YncA